MIKAPLALRVKEGVESHGIHREERDLQVLLLNTLPVLKVFLFLVVWFAHPPSFLLFVLIFFFFFLFFLFFSFFSFC